MVKRLRPVAVLVARAPMWARWVAGAVLGVALVAFVVWLVIDAPRRLVPAASDVSLRDVTDAAKRHELQDTRLELQNDVRTTLLQGLGALAVLVGAGFTYRQLRLAREGQVTERFNKAIDHLGKRDDDRPARGTRLSRTPRDGKHQDKTDDKIDVRLGAVYALERIAKNSKDDREAIAEILAAYVRIQAPWPPTRVGQLPEGALLDEDRAGLRARAPDIQAALTVLGRRPPPPRKTDPLLLHHADLRDAGLVEANLERADLRGAHLERADLRGADLRKADLRGAHLERADLRGADLRKADLRGVHLEEARLDDVRLRGAWRTARPAWPKVVDPEAAVELHNETDQGHPWDSEEPSPLAAPTSRAVDPP
jgi:hypothetical protein